MLNLASCFKISKKQSTKITRFLIVPKKESASLPGEWMQVFLKRDRRVCKNDRVEDFPSGANFKSLYLTMYFYYQ